MSMFTSAEKMGFTRCRTRAAPRGELAYQVGFMSPDVARTSDAGSRSKAANTAAGGTRSGWALMRRHDSRKPALAGGSEVNVELREDASRAFRTAVVVEYAVAAQSIMLAHFGA